MSFQSLHRRKVISFAAIAALSLLFAPHLHAAVRTKGVSVRIMPVGDSITEGKFVSGGYRRPLQQMLKDAGYFITYVGKEDNGAPANATGFSTGMTNGNHEGYGSMRIDEILNGGDEEGHHSLPIAQTMAANRPDVVLLMIGTNDIFQARDSGGLLGRLDDLVGRIFTARKSVILLMARITPFRDDPVHDEAASIYNSGMPLIVAKYKAQEDRVVLVNMHSALDPAHDLGGVHPNAAGYQKMAAVWFAALTCIAPPAPVAEAPTPASGGALSFSSAVADGSTGPYCLGYKFTTGGQPIAVASLGYLNDGASGNGAMHTVGIHDDASQTLVTAAVSVTTHGGDLSGTHASFTYAALPSPVTLKPNTTYDIVGTTSGVGFLKAPVGTTCAYGIAVASMRSAYANGATLAYPTSTYAPNDPANIGPNFIARK